MIRRLVLTLVALFAFEATSTAEQPGPFDWMHVSTVQVFGTEIVTAIRRVPTIRGPQRFVGVVVVNGVPQGEALLTSTTKARAAQEIKLRVGQK